jgi:hypothetical protein
MSEPMTYDDFVGDDAFLRSLKDITAFTLTLTIPPVPLPGDGVALESLGNALYQELHNVVNEAGFYHEDALRVAQSSRGLAIEYLDDEFHFEVRIDSGRITLIREGSRLETFLGWYQALMPSIEGIVSTAEAILEREAGVPLPIIRGSYAFQFLVHDLKKGASSIRNAEVMQNLVRQYPAEDGRIAPYDPGQSPEAHDEALRNVGRVDFKFSQLTGDEDRRRFLWYTVEAPGNKRYSSLWFQFEYQGTSFTDPDGNRFRFAPEGFLAESDDALELLRERGIKGFMCSLLDECTFETTPARRVP